MTKVHLNLPKFQVESEISLVKPLKALGIYKLFESSADLRGISDREISLEVDNVIQKAIVKFDQSG